MPADRFGYAQSNVAFHQGYIEKLDELPLEDASFDVIVSNCVLNLAMDKPAVLREAYRLLKPGGEMYFSDVYADRRVPEALRADPVLYGECLSGALYWNDFEYMARAAGFADPRLVTHRALTVENPELEAKVAPIKFMSATYRLFKLDLEPECEDYGQAVIYKGTVPGAPHEFVLDGGHVIETSRVSRSVATLSKCWPTHALHRISSLSAIFPRITAFSQAAAGPAPLTACRTAARPHPPVAVAKAALAC